MKFGQVDDMDLVDFRLPIIGEETPQLLKNYESKKKVRIITTVSEVIKGVECKCLMIVVYGNEAFFRYVVSFCSC